MKRALVLGGGGAVGVAWEVGLLAGLLDGGIDVRDADLIVGTSAGAFVGASIAHGEDPRDMLRGIRDPEAQAAAPAERPEPDMETNKAIWGILADGEPMTRERCARVGALAMQARTMTEEAWLTGYRAMAWSGWPAKPLIAAAVECESGELRAFDSGDDVPIELAVAGSCAVPGMFPPVSIDGKHYTDGGVRSWNNADLAQRIQPDIVLVVAVFGVLDRGIHVPAARQLAEETAALEAGGASVRVIKFDQSAIQASGGMNMMDAAKRIPTAAAAEAHGRRIAPDLVPWWAGD